MIRLIIVEHQHKLHTKLRTKLQEAEDILIVGEASTKVALQLAYETHPDIIITDVITPDIPGLNILEHSKQLLPQPKVIILNHSNNLFLPSIAFRVGATSYLNDEATGDELLSAVRDSYEGKTYISPTISRQLALKHIGGLSPEPIELLSDRELQIMLMIVAKKKINDIAEFLKITPKTVNTYRYRMFAKLGIKNDVQLLHAANRYGLVSI